MSALIALSDTLLGLNDLTVIHQTLIEAAGAGHSVGVSFEVRRRQI
jgi:hypothetical protein